MVPLKLGSMVYWCNSFILLFTFLLLQQPFNQLHMLLFWKLFIAFIIVMAQAFMNNQSSDIFLKLLISRESFYFCFWYEKAGNDHKLYYPEINRFTLFVGLVLCNFHYILNHGKQDFWDLFEIFCGGIFNGWKGFVGIIIISNASNMFFSNIKDFEKVENGFVSLKIFYLNVFQYSDLCFFLFFQFVHPPHPFLVNWKLGILFHIL